MATKITIVIEVDDNGGVSVETGNDLNRAKDVLPEAECGIEHVFDEDTSTLPFTLEGLPDPPVYNARKEHPDNISREAEDIIAENNDRFVKQFAEKMSDNPVIGSAVVESLVSDDVLDAIEEEAKQRC